MLHWLAIIKNSAEEVTYVEYGIVDLAGVTGRLRQGMFAKRTPEKWN